MTSGCGANLKSTSKGDKIAENEKTACFARYYLDLCMVGTWMRKYDSIVEDRFDR